MTFAGYLLDENVDPRLGRAVRRDASGIAVWHIGDPGAPPRGASDPEVLRWCEANGFILVTNNRASMPGHLQDHIAAGRHIAGIFILPDGAPINESAADLALVWATSEPGEYADQIRYLPVSS